MGAVTLSEQPAASTVDALAKLRHRRAATSPDRCYPTQPERDALAPGSACCIFHRKKISQFPRRNYSEM